MTTTATDTKTAQYTDYAACILAAGKGTRMYSERPKVLQELLGESLLRYVFTALDPVFGERIWTIIGHGAKAVQAEFANEARHFILQTEQKGTGHALMCAWDELAASGARYVLVVNGDTPLITTAHVERFLDACQNADADLAFMTLTPEDIGSFGRVVRQNGAVSAIIEAKDYDEKLHGKTPKEINAGVYCLKISAIAPLLQHLGNNNASGEYYITDLVGFAVAKKLSVLGVPCGDDKNLLGINNPLELSDAEEYLRAHIVREHLRRGVHIHAPQTVFIGPRVSIEQGAHICGPVHIYGTSSIAAGAKVEAYCFVKNTKIAAKSELRQFSHAENAELHEGALAGPYARLRIGAVLEKNAHMGNFVEMKKARLGEGAKANHLTYLGDAVIGAGTNIGAGTITCNYDGKNKFTTTIGKHAFIGSNTALVAPVTVGDGALIGAGSTITKDVPENTLGIGRERQKNLPLKSRS